MNKEELTTSIKEHITKTVENLKSKGLSTENAEWFGKGYMLGIAKGIELERILKAGGIELVMEFGSAKKREASQ